MSETIFHIEGGLGKNILATSVIRSYKRGNPDRNIIVTSAYPEIFHNNPNVDRAYNINNTPYFYRDHIYGKDVEILAHDPYKTTQHITQKKHLVESWCEMVGAEYMSNHPEIFLNFREIEMARKLLNPTDKPILIFQPFGGPIVQQLPYSWTRDIHPEIAQIIVNQLKDKYDIVHICHKHHPHLKDVRRFDEQVNKRILAAMLYSSERRILVDSSLQHAAAAFGLISNVVWVATSPKLFGHDIHNNILPKVSKPEGSIDSYLFDYNFTGTVQECPYSNYYDIFNIDKIIEGL
jgi:ADP-heptose:LPS heptosyltransferase